MKLSKVNKQKLKNELKSLKIKGDWVDEDQFTATLLTALKNKDSAEHNYYVFIAKGVLGLDESVQPVRESQGLTLEDFLS